MVRDGVPIGAITVSRSRAGALPDRQIELLQDLRRPGGDRHRERAALQGARAAQPRPHRDPRAADGDRRDPARHLQLADRRPAGLRHHRPERDAALRADVLRRVSIRRAAPSLRRAHHGSTPEARKPRAALSPRRWTAGAPRSCRAQRGGRTDSRRHRRSGLRVAGRGARRIGLPQHRGGPDAPRRRAHRRHHGRGAWRADSSRTARSRCSRPSPTRRSSPSRTSVCSRSSTRGTATSPRRSSSRRRPARSCGSSPARRPTSSPSSTPSPPTPLRLCGATWRAVLRFDGELIHLVSYHNVGARRHRGAPRALSRGPDGRRSDGRAPS